jgi:hypothetical protein
MVASFKAICLIAAIIFFALGVFYGVFAEPTNRWGRFSPMALGLFFYALKDAVPG